MGNENFNNNKPSHPAPPLNALKNPEVNKPVQPEKTEKKEAAPFRSVYDEIAERRKHEKHKIGVTSAEERGDAMFKSDKNANDSKQNAGDDDVKVYTPEKQRAEEEIFSGSEPAEPVKTEPVTLTEETKDIYIDDSPHEAKDENEENFDVPSLPKPKKKLGPWVAIISALGALCVIAAGAYGAVNGYFDGLIKMF